MEDHARLSSIQASQPEFAIFRLYMPLQALHLNVLQAEIAHLRQGLGLQLELDGASGNTEKLFSHCPLQPASNPGQDLQNLSKKALWNRLDATLERYSNALFRYRNLSQFPSVDPLHHKHLRLWNTDPDGGHGCFHGVEAGTWDIENAGDLTSIAAVTEGRDSLTHFINTRFLPWYHGWIGHKHKQRTYVADAFTGERKQTPVYYYSDKLVVSVVNICSIVLSSMIPALCSLALYFIQREGIRMGAIVIFTFLFSAVIALVTPAKRIETFVATAAFAAVLIVFVGNGAEMGSTC